MCKDSQIVLRQGQDYYCDYHYYVYYYYYYFKYIYHLCIICHWVQERCLECLESVTVGKRSVSFRQCNCLSWEESPVCPWWTGRRASCYIHVNNYATVYIQLKSSMQECCCLSKLGTRKIWVSQTIKEVRKVAKRTLYYQALEFYICCSTTFLLISDGHAVLSVAGSRRHHPQAHGLPEVPPAVLRHHHCCQQQPVI